MTEQEHNRCAQCNGAKLPVPELYAPTIPMDTPYGRMGIETFGHASRHAKPTPDGYRHEADCPVRIIQDLLAPSPATDGE